MSRNIFQPGSAELDVANLQQRLDRLEGMVRGLPATIPALSLLDALWASRTATMQPLMVTPGVPVPAGALLANAQAVSRTTFPKLFAAIGTTYGSGDGVTTFNVPDMRGRTFAGMDAMYGADAARLPSSFGGSRDTMGAAGGADVVTLSGAQSGMPGFTVNSGQGFESNGMLRHIVNVTPGSASNYGAQHLSHTSPANAGYFDYSGGGSHAMLHYHQTTVGTFGASQSHNNMQPTMLGAWIIWTGERP